MPRGGIKGAVLGGSYARDTVDPSLDDREKRMKKKTEKKATTLVNFLR